MKRWYQNAQIYDSDEIAMDKMIQLPLSSDVEYIEEKVSVYSILSEKFIDQFNIISLLKLATTGNLSIVHGHNV